MDKLKDEINNKISIILDRYNYIQSNYKGEFKKNLLLYDQINCNLTDIDNILDEYELDNKENIEIDNELNLRIEENKKMQDIMKVFCPYILLYQLNN